jgi:hypothetical protein
MKEDRPEEARGFAVNVLKAFTVITAIVPCW